MGWIFHSQLSITFTNNCDSKTTISTVKKNRLLFTSTKLLVFTGKKCKITISFRKEKKKAISNPHDITRAVKGKEKMTLTSSWRSDGVKLKVGPATWPLFHSTSRQSPFLSSAPFESYFCLISKNKKKNKSYSDSISIRKK